MNVIVTTISTEIDKLKRRVVKVLRMGKSDVQTAIEISPAGTDSVPLKDLVAVYAPTNQNGKTVILGYLVKNKKAAAGEYRTFALDENGEEVFYTWMKKNGTMEIGGDGNFAVRFNELKTEFNALKSDFNSLVSTFNAHTHSVPGITSGPSATNSLVPTGTPVNPNTSDIDNAKNDKIKTI